MSALLDIGMGLLSGGATGIVGLGLQSLFGWLGQRAKTNHEIEMRKLDLEQTRVEGENAVKFADASARAAEGKADAEAFAKSYDLEPQRYATGSRPEGKIGTFGWALMVCLDFVRGAIRPGLTIWLAYEAMSSRTMAEKLLKEVDPALYQTMLIDAYGQLTFTLCYLFSTCVTWWFGTRMKHLRDASAK